MNAWNHIVHRGVKMSQWMRDVNEVLDSIYEGTWTQ
jgi:hypothetical protein